VSPKSPANPFRVGTEIRDPADFVGRRSILEAISRKMSDLQNVSLHGERRTGKTSLLLYLFNPASVSVTGLQSNHVPVYFDFQRFAEVSAANVWQSITEAVADQIKQRLPNGEVESEQFLATVARSAKPSDLFVTGLEQALAHLNSSGIRIHLLFDEFEQTARNPNLGDSFYKALRSLPGQTRNISYVIATRTGLADLELELSDYGKLSSPFFNIFTTLTLRPFEEYEVTQLILDYFDRSQLDFALAEKLRAQIQFLYEVTGYHPFFLQALCYHLFERLNEPDWPLA
jgi:AAA+ ATPase superfamily predicted ATPase